MRKLTVLWILMLGFTATAHENFELPLDLSTSEYQAKLNQEKAVQPYSLFRQLQDGLEEPIRLGERALKWVDTINANRKTNKIILTSKETQKAYPIESPKIYNLQIIQRDFQAFLSSTPNSILQVLQGTSNQFPAEPPMDDKTFTEIIRKGLSSYDIAARWRLLSPYLPQLADRIKRDVRGYVYFSKISDPIAFIANFQKNTEAEQEQTRAALLSMCFNGRSQVTACQRDIQNAGNNPQALINMYNQHINAAKSTYESYFNIPNYARRSDVRVAEVLGKTIVKMPFRDPDTADLWTFLDENIRDEWKGESWSLNLERAAKNKSGTAYLVMVPGATANVEYLGGNRITMDKNVALDDYNQTWTIRHEFGHVLGFPDCYNEFYDQAEGVVISYQIDIDNLMCSRRGKIQPIHESELLRQYGTHN